MDENKRLGMLWAPFIADAYALGAHWVYNQTQITNSSVNYPISKEDWASCFIMP